MTCWYCNDPMAFESNVYGTQRKRKWYCQRCGERIMDHDDDYQHPDAATLAATWEANATWLKDTLYGPKKGTRVFVELRGGALVAEWFNSEGGLCSTVGCERGDFELDLDRDRRLSEVRRDWMETDMRQEQRWREYYGNRAYGPYGV